MEKQQETLTLADLRPAKGSHRKKLRVGRGRASGAGKTANRGHNGQGQRSGEAAKTGFEGGQMPGYRQMPKIKGIKWAPRKQWLVLNVGDLDRYMLPEETTLTPVLLEARGFLKNRHEGVRLLGNGDVTRAITLEVHHASASAREKIEAAGGKIVSVE